MKKSALLLFALLTACAAEQKSAPMSPSEERAEAVTEEAVSVPVTTDSDDEAAKQDAPAKVVAQKPSGLAALVGGHQAFAFDLQKLQPAKNTVYSPHSIATVLEVLHAGAQGDTATQLQKALRLPAEPTADFHRALADALAKRQKTQNGLGFRLRVANGLWVNDGFALATPFLQQAENNFLVRPQNVNFANSEVARQTINQAVSDATEAKIPHLLPDGILSQNTRLVLTNAVYFNAPWRVPFQKSATQDAAFTLLDQSQVTAAFMEQTDTFAYLREQDFQAIEIPYAGSEVVAVVVLPDAGKYERVDASMSSTRFANVLGAMSRQRTTLRLPRFNIRTAMDLVPHMKALGVVDAFDDKAANFERMLAPGSTPLYVSAFLHEAMMTVDEAGTEAAAATAAVMTTRGLSAPPQTIFEANRPFTMYIVDKPTQEILFVSKVLNPAG